MKYIKSSSLLALTLLFSSGFVNADNKQTLIEAATAGDTAAQSELGTNYFDGINGFDKDVVEAKKWIDLAAEKGDKVAYYALGVMYTFGEGVDKDLNKAVEYYKLAGDAREGRAYNNLGAIYQKGMLGKVDHALAIKYFKLASDAGYVKASYLLGAYYQYGKGVQKSYKKAFTYYKKAADQGSSDGMFALGTLYDDGLGVKRNDAEAIKWYKKAAELGNVDAMTNLGIMYENGEGVKKDYKKAADFYQAACDNGDKSGCKYIAELKESGKYRAPASKAKTKSATQRLIAKSIDKGVNATFTWQGDDATFTANDGKVDCTFLKDFSEKGGNLATSFVCTDNVQIILKQFRDTKNAYLAVMTDNFNTEVKSFSVNVYVTNTGSN
ncbi:TPA: tetratricopeptide repeat protein [Escherichia coli]|jgi:TPR repeat protein|uniref:Tetratricopeptide repeat family protein n=5 Tax=Escherichia coli TaxID=562 RepID=A0A6M4P8P7_ECOLX|nr:MULTISPECIES: tetratricopeptide repeat protein [Escherichia]EJC8914497.1 sel1 repeat family protein [Escherichia coli]EJE7587553.1 sel1 repeat family protein [Escherichia coli]EJF7643411.1 sel1 repeat family protein [Escherichia coli]EJN0077474.1 sel1 repeat family protein [Escherichia coli]EJN0079308.1 sel1 repeat family protein [Escherichia coli]